MALGGGTWLAQNKVLPGTYINFASSATTALMGERGIASLPLELNWGKAEMIIMDSAEFNRQAQSVLGYSSTSSELLLVREALKRAKQLKIYRVNADGSKASTVLGGVTVTAVCAGARGNDIKIVCQTNVDDESKFDVLTYLETSMADSQTVANADELVANDFVTFSSGTLEVTAGLNLTGGSNGNVDGQKYSDYLNALEVETFHTFGYPGTDASIKALFVAYTKRLREDEGKKVVAVLCNYPADYEGVINVVNGVVLTDGTVVDATKAVAWVAGATAGAQINQSLTNTNYDDAVDTDIKYTSSQYESMIKKGNFVFYPNDCKAAVLRDINSFISFSPTRSEDFADNKIIRVMDSWATDNAYVFNNYYLGKVSNNEDGRILLKADLVSLGGQYQAAEAIQEFSADSIKIEQGKGKRDVYSVTELNIVGAMEKFYISVVVV